MDTFSQTLGGLGLFLLGMISMTEALRSIAGDAIRTALMRFTQTPVSGVITGAISTAILQSSSLTTVATVGFVSAGLISFTQSLGILFGANIGTTITGWLVALIGFKLQIGQLMLPMIFIGVMLRLFAKKPLAHIGMILTGFALIFLGISTMQLGMSNLQGVVTPEFFPEDNLSGRIKLLAIGILITLVTQSSSAGVATALTAVFTGTISFEQAAALVIGMDVGTSFTAVLATIGGSVNTKRTGFSHMSYNFLTAIGALLLLTPYTFLWEYVAPGALLNEPEIALVGFHSLFNLLGILIILPFTGIFARFMQNIIPDKADAYTEDLDQKLLQEPVLALTAAEASIRIELIALLKYLQTMLADDQTNHTINLNDLQIALDKTHAYIDHIHLEKSNHPNWEILISTLHSLDHMQRLHERCDEDANRAKTVKSSVKLNDQLKKTLLDINGIINSIEKSDWKTAHHLASKLVFISSTKAGETRQQIINHVGHGEFSVQAGTHELEGIRWLNRVSEHINKIIHYQASTQQLLRRP